MTLSGESSRRNWESGTWSRPSCSSPRYHDADINWWTCCYEVIWDRPIRVQEEEIAWGRFMSEAELTAQLDQLPFVPDGLVAFRRYLDESNR